MHRNLDIVILGLSVTSSWGNGHATIYRGLGRQLCQRGHGVLFLERDKPWYARNRDLTEPDNCSLFLYGSLEELKDQYTDSIRRADAVVIGSYVPDGIEVNDWIFSEAAGVTAFYDIDTPVTLAALARSECSFLSARQISKFDLYLSFSAGPILTRLRDEYKARNPLPLLCSVDPDVHYPQHQINPKYDLGYMGTYSPDRESALEEMLLKPAWIWHQGRFALAGSQYPEVDWPPNLDLKDHLIPPQHSSFYNSQRFTLNLTRADMIRAGFSPSVRLFEAAACATPVISDYWRGLENFFEIGKEILVASSADGVLTHLAR